MRVMLASILLAATPVMAVQAQAAGDGQSAATTPDDEGARLDQAFELVKNGKPNDAIRLADQVISAMESRYAKRTDMLFCARSMSETILYSGLTAAAKKSGAVLDDTWCYAYFVKGFALIDAGRADEARPWFDKAIALAPMNAQFLAERGEWHKSRKEWDAAYADFETAARAADFSPDDAQSPDRRRAWRGMAFARIEQGKLAEATKLLEQCLKLDGNDEMCKRELDYVKGLRR